MKLAACLTHYGKDASTEVLVRFAQGAERLDYDSVWVLERLLRPANPRNVPYEGWQIPEYYPRVYDPIETLTYVAAKTERIELGTSVIDP